MDESSLENTVQYFKKHPEDFPKRILTKKEQATLDNKQSNAFIDFINEPQHQIEGPLSGLLYSIKDCFWLHQRRPTLGVDRKKLTQLPVENDARILSLLNQKGALPIGFTNMFPLAMDISGENPWLGKIKYGDHLVLGSTSGGACAVKAKHVDFSIGSDSGGSIRAPAASLGLCGFMSRLCSFPMEGMIHHGEDIDSPGFITKDLTDMQYLLRSITDCGVTKTNPEVLSIPISELSMCDSDTKSAYAKIASDLGAKEEHSIMKLFLEALSLRKNILLPRLKVFIENQIEDRSDLPELFEAIYKGANESIHVQTQLNKFQSTVVSVFTENTIVLAPTLPFLPTRSQDIRDAPLNIFLTLANLTPLHAVSFPVLVNGPFSLQIMSRASVNFVLSFALSI